MIFLLLCASLPILALGLLMPRVGYIQTRIVTPLKTKPYQAGFYSEQEIEDLRKQFPGDTWTEVAGPEYSATHWQYYIRAFVSAESDKYIRNFHRVEEEMELRELGEDVNLQYEDYRPGTILVKAHYKDERDPDLKKVTFMVKEADGYDTAYKNWRFVEFVDGKKVLDGNSSDERVYKSCIQCHNNVNARHLAYNNYLHKRLRVSNVD